MKKSLILLSFFLLPVIAFPQTVDSLHKSNAVADTSASIQDTSAVQDTSTGDNQYDVEAVVNAEANDSLIFKISDKKMNLYGESKLEYKNTKLNSGKIYVDFATSEVEAEGIKDTSDTASSGYIQTPVLSENEEVYEGRQLSYNFKTRRGFISLAKNQKEDTEYRGEKVKKVADDVYFIEDGMYTTCGGKNPVTYFKAKKMKVIRKEQIIARWIWMYIGGVPFPIPLPFGVFPNQKGRRSGIMTPAYGSSNLQGQYFKDFGYFWAISDYMDLTLLGDYYTQGGYGIESRFRYKKRYNYQGNISGGYSNLVRNEEGDPDRTEQTDWNIKVRHNHQITPTMQFNANLSFQSQDFLENNRTSYDDLLRQRVYSNATFSKRWRESGNNLTVSYSRTQNLQDGDIQETLPSVSFNMPQMYPFRSDVTSATEWYDQIGFNYNGKFQNRRNKSKGDLKIRGGFEHNISMNASPEIGHFNISPNFRYSEKWYNKRIKQYSYVNPETGLKTDTLVTETVKEINMVRSFSTGVSASTKLYGMMQPQMLGVKAFRHTFSPSVSYSYTPDFSEDKWGYYDTYINAEGEEEKYNKFSQEVFGGPSRGERQNINMSLGNVFEMKTMADPTDTTSKEDKITLLNLDANLSYNFAADSLKFSDVRVSYRTKIGDYLNFNGSSRYSFYDQVQGRRIDEFLYKQGKGLLRLTNFNVSLSTSLSGEKLSGSENKEEADTSAFGDFEEEEDNNTGTFYGEEEPDLSIPWNMSLNWNYNIDKSDPNDISRRSNISANLSLNLTEKWKLSVQGSYDLVNKDVSAPRVNIYRDLDCWEMNFNWYPIGRFRGFRFEIRIKSPELQDLKVTKSEGLFTGVR
jgi:lipopolysaccharide assembly outer membrane protein LptD (OstA)